MPGQSTQPMSDKQMGRCQVLATYAWELVLNLLEKSTQNCVKGLTIKPIFEPNWASSNGRDLRLCLQLCKTRCVVRLELGNFSKSTKLPTKCSGSPTSNAACASIVAWVSRSNELRRDKKWGKCRCRLDLAVPKTGAPPAFGLGHWPDPNQLPPEVKNGNGNFGDTD